MSKLKNTRIPLIPLFQSFKTRVPLIPFFSKLNNLCSPNVVLFYSTLPSASMTQIMYQCAFVHKRYPMRNYPLHRVKGIESGYCQTRDVLNYLHHLISVTIIFRDVFVG